MPGRRAVAPLGDLDTLFRLGVMADWPDSRLLDQFASRGDPAAEAAFEALVRRHGPMVWRACLGLLRDPNAAEDAFQATFLVLARRAGSIRNRDPISGWLYGVARRIALRARLDADRRRALERLASRPEAISPAPDPHEARREEGARLPAHYRLPVLLHDLGGCSYDEVARRLGCPIGTVKARLSRARSLLRRRLTRRGLPESTATTPPPPPPASALPAALAGRTVRSAVSLSMGRSALDAVPPAVAASAHWMLNAMIASQLKASAAVAATLLLLAAGAGLVVASQDRTAPPPGSSPPPVATAAAVVPAFATPLPRVPQAPPPEEINRRALEIATALDDPNDRAEVLLSLAITQTRRGHPDQALDTLRQARLAAEQIPPRDLESSDPPIVRIASAQADAGDPEAALDTFRASIKVVEAMGETRQSIAWRGFLDRWLDAIGRTDIRTVTVPYLAFAERSDFRDLATTAVSLDAVAGDFDRALETVATSESFRGPRNALRRRMALLEIADALHPGDGPIIDLVLSEARRAAVSGAPPRPGEPAQADEFGRHALFRIARVEAKLGRLSDALETCRRVDTSGPADVSVGLKRTQAQGFLDIARAQFEAGDRSGARETVDEGVRVVEAIDRPALIPQLARLAADLYLKLGAIDEGEALVEDIDQTWEQYGQTWSMVAAARRAAGDEAGARVPLSKGFESTEARLRTLLAQPPNPNLHHNPNPFVLTTDPLTNAAITVAGTQLELGDVEAAIRTGDALPATSRAEFLPAIAATLASRGELGAAWSLVERIDSPDLRDRAIVRIAIALPEGPSEEAPPDRE